ncbi:hypothetical protein C0995_001561 [Termitomyces sp. Mi166|nr:hypothetical protein C0995_001561 [Termitomyces sp. Mi166\
MDIYVRLTVGGSIAHRVKPDKTEEYKKAAYVLVGLVSKTDLQSHSYSETYYLGIKNDSKLNAKLTGSWEIVVGEQDTFVHILEYENYGGLDKTINLVRSSPEHVKAFRAMLPYLQSRSSQLNQEFAFFPSAPPRAQGGIFELRAYTLQPGTLLEWETTWYITCGNTRVFDAIDPVAPSDLVFRSLEARKELREQAWQIDGWAETVSKTAQLAKSMDSFIMKPLPFSPLK